MLSHFAVVSADEEQLNSAIEQYFTCEAAGSGADCDRSHFDKSVYPGLVTSTFALLGFLPCVSLIFVVNWRGVKETFQGIFHKIHPTGSSKLLDKDMGETKEIIVAHSESDP